MILFFYYAIFPTKLKDTSKLNSTRDSISAKERISGTKSFPAASGFLAIPSRAFLAIPDWDKAPKLEAMHIHRLLLRAIRPELYPPDVTTSLLAITGTDKINNTA